MSFEMNPITILETYDFTNKNRTEDLCVVTTKDGRKYLDTIDKKESHSPLNLFFKAVFGSGPLANKDTSIKGVEEYLVELFSSDEDNEIKKMKLDSPAYKTTAKIAELAQEKGFDSLEKVIKVDKDINVGEAKFKTVEDLQKFVGLIKIRTDLKTKIDKLKEELAAVPAENSSLKAILQQRISNFERLEQTNSQKLFIVRWGSEIAKKLPFEDLQVLINNKHVRFIKDNQITEQELKILVDSLRLQENKEILQEVKEEVQPPEVKPKEEFASNILGKVEKEVETIPQEPLSIEEILKKGQKHVDGLSKEEFKEELFRIYELITTTWEIDEQYVEYYKMLFNDQKYADDLFEEEIKTERLYKLLTASPGISEIIPQVNPSIGKPEEEIASDVLGKVEKEPETVSEENLSFEEIMKDPQKYESELSRTKLIQLIQNHVDSLSKEQLKKEMDRVLEMMMAPDHDKKTYIYVLKYKELLTKKNEEF